MFSSTSPSVYDCYPTSSPQTLPQFMIVTPQVLPCCLSLSLRLLPHKFPAASPSVYDCYPTSSPQPLPQFMIVTQQVVSRLSIASLSSLVMFCIVFFSPPSEQRQQVQQQKFRFHFRYGDRAPQSLLGRFFAVVWILLGICIISIFTATLTTSLTAISLDTTKSLPGTKVTCMTRSGEPGCQ